MTPYEILGVSPSASQDEIKAAYMRAVKTAHPDAGGSHEEFVKLQNAYDELKNFKPKPSFNPMDDFIRHAREAVFRQYADVFFNVSLTLEEIYSGTVIAIGDTNVEIPAGTPHGTRIVQYGSGNTVNGVTGNIVLTVIHAPHERFQSQGHHLHMKYEISAIDAIFGTTVDITTIDGELVSLPIPPHSQIGGMLTVKGKGMPFGSSRGDLGVHVAIRIPTVEEAIVELEKHGYSPS